MNIKKVGVVGFGAMGSGIAQSSAQNGFETFACDINQEFLDRGMKTVETFLQKGMERGKVTESEKKDTLSRLRVTTQLKDLKDCDLIIEAIVENMIDKKKLFAALDSLAQPHAIFASNTSGLSVTEMGSAANRGDRCCGMHFFNPAQIMKLVEVAKALQTSDETIETACAFVRAIKKEPVVCADTPGFIVNRILIPYLNQAVQALEDGLNTKENIEKAITLGLGFPMGPFRLMDLAGIDVHLKASNALYDEFKDPMYAPPPLLRKMAGAGFHGRKTKKGFFDYP